MSGYSLEIQIDTSGVKQISGADLSVALLHTQDQSDYLIVGPTMPASNTIMITWDTTQSVYTSQYDLAPYEVLMINNGISALEQQVYTYDGSGIQLTGSTTAPETIQLRNKSGAQVTSGLAKPFTINSQPQGTTIMTALTLLNNGLASYPISETYLLTVMGEVETGMAVPKDTIPTTMMVNLPTYNTSKVSAQPALALDFTAANQSQTVHYETSLSCFQNGALPS